MLVDAAALRDRLRALLDQNVHGAGYRRGVRDALVMLEDVEALAMGTQEHENPPVHDRRARVADLMDRAQLASLRD